MKFYLLFTLMLSACSTLPDDDLCIEAWMYYHTERAIIYDKHNRPLINDPILEEKFSSFWREFRHAFLRKDMDSLATFVRFPLIKRGILDSCPVVNISRGRFNTEFSSFLDDEAHVLRDIRTARPYIPSAWRWYRIGDMNFEYIDSKWFLTEIYGHTSEPK